MRSKEEAHDYRYFPDPDLLPVIVDKEWKNEIARFLPELPDAKLHRFVNNFSLPVYDAEIITQTKSLANYYEEVISVTDDYKIASNWVTGDVLAVINDKKIDISDFPVSPLNLGKLINLINDGTISGKIAKEIFPNMLENNADPEQIVKEKNLVQISDTSEIEAIIQKIINANTGQVEEYRSGKEKVFGFFVGQVMKESKGKANPKLVNEILKTKLELMR
jgi:aspartyl-tRNA(Asn)/glutamyl-tRNA(Gln) amidotransferase subunit B